MRLIYSILLMLALSLGQGLAATPAPALQGIFTSVNGKVQVQKAKGKAKTVKKDATVKEGESIITSKGADASVRFFDGSELKISPNTNFTISKLQKPSIQDKVIRFKLAFGKLLASVKKLATSRSSFEIEAGGVVCGVRGTEYSYSYDPDTKQVTVHVNEGTVYLNVNGTTYVFTAGQTAIFTNGNPDKNNPDNGNKGDKGDKDGGKKEGNSGIADLNQQFQNGILIDPGNAAGNNPIDNNGGNNFNDPAVEGGDKITVHANVGAVEAVP